MPSEGFMGAQQGPVTLGKQEGPVDKDAEFKKLESEMSMSEIRVVKAIEELGEVMMSFSTGNTYDRARGNQMHELMRREDRGENVTDQMLALNLELGNKALETIERLKRLVTEHIAKQETYIRIPLPGAENK